MGFSSDRSSTQTKSWDVTDHCPVILPILCTKRATYNAADKKGYLQLGSLDNGWVRSHHNATQTQSKGSEYCSCQCEGQTYPGLLTQMGTHSLGITHNLSQQDWPIKN